MGELIDGRYVSDEESAIVDAMMADAKTYFGEDLNDSDEAVIRYFYRPVAKRLLEVQRNLGLILDSSQIEHARGEALDMLTALIGVSRNPAKRSIGEIVISIESTDTVDHTIPRGTEVSTNGIDPVLFSTTSGATLSGGQTSVTIPVEAVNSGLNANVGQNTIVNFPSGTPFPGAQVTNPAGTEGGTQEENDADLRQRAKTGLSEGSRATASAIVTQTQSIDGVYNVSVFINDTGTLNGRGHNLPPHSFELVAATDGSEETLKLIAQRLMETKSIGDNSVTGKNGGVLDSGKSFVSAEGEIETILPNNQTHPVGFSVASTVEIYVDVDIEVTNNYKSDKFVKNSIIDYLGGTNSNGTNEDGKLGVGENIVHAQVERTILDVEGVYDINTVTIGKTDNPTQTTNLVIGDFEEPLTDATDAQYLTVTTTQV